jgi:hypothetical protein
MTRKIDPTKIHFDKNTIVEIADGGKHSPVVQIRVSEQTRDKLRATAKDRGRASPSCPERCSMSLSNARRRGDGLEPMPQRSRIESTRHRATDRAALV